MSGERREDAESSGEPTRREAKKPPREILIQELIEGESALERRWRGLFISGLSAGLDIGFSVLLIATMATAMEGRMSPAVLELLMANLYAVGFIFVVIGRAELFTEQTTLAVLPFLSGRTGLVKLGRLWATVLAANLIGAAAFAAALALVATRLEAISADVLVSLAAKKVEPSAAVMFGSAVFAGWLMGLLSWLVAASRETISQIVIVWIIATVIGLTGLHHVVVGSVEVLAGVFANGADVTWSDFGWFLLVTATGNAFGGSVFVALIKYSYAKSKLKE